MCWERRLSRRRQAVSQRGPRDRQYRGQEAEASVEIQQWNKPCSQGQELEKSYPKLLTINCHKTPTPEQVFWHLKTWQADQANFAHWSFIGCSSWILHNLISFPIYIPSIPITALTLTAQCLKMLAISLWSSLSFGSFLAEINVKLWT